MGSCAEECVGRERMGEIRSCSRAGEPLAIVGLAVIFCAVNVAFLTKSQDPCNGAAGHQKKLCLDKRAALRAQNGSTLFDVGSKRGCT